MQPPVHAIASISDPACGPHTVSNRSRPTFQITAQMASEYFQDARTDNEAKYRSAFGGMRACVEALHPFPCRQVREGRVVHTTFTEAAPGDVTAWYRGYLFVLRLNGPPDSPTDLVEVLAMARQE